MTNGPVLIDLEDHPGARPPDVASAPPVPDPDMPAPGAAMRGAAALAARRPSRLARWFWALAGALLVAALSVAAWDFATALLARAPLLGGIVSALLAGLVLVALAIALRELAAIARLGRVDALRRQAEAARASGDLEAARAAARALIGFYAGRDDTRWGRERLAEQLGDAFDAAAVLERVEDTLLAPLDARARAEVETAARQVATVTALVPLALADVIAALSASLRMIRRIAEIYGGRSGTIGSWRLTRAVLTHLVATGAVAAGDDLLEPVLGGSVLSRLSRRFGEGLVNGALSARVGVAAMEVCRPLAFTAPRRPSVRAIIARALSGLLPGRGRGGAGPKPGGGESPGS